MVNDITVKNKLGQLFCRHKNQGWYVDNSNMAISGEKRLLICRDCGKVVNEMFARYEGMGYK